MKTFQKIALVSAIAAAPFAAQAELVAVEDAFLAETTGQAGVTIDMSIGDDGITIGSLTYTDTDTASDTDGGSVVMQNIAVKNITKLSQTIDISEKGNLVMGMSGSQALVKQTVGANGVLAASVLTGSGADALKITGKTVAASDLSSIAVSGKVNGVAVVDSSSITADEATAINTARLSAGTGVKGIEISLGGTAATSAVLLKGTAANAGEAELVNNLKLNVDLGNSSTIIHNLANGATGTLADAGVTAAVTKDLKPAMAIQMTSSFRLNDLDVGVFGYTELQANKKVATGIAAASAASDTAADFLDADGKLKAGAAGADIVVKADGTKAGAAATAYATGAAVKIENMSFVGLDGGLVTATQTIWADEKGVNIAMGSIQGNLNIGSIEIGGASIGSVAISNLNLAGMTQTIYGH